MNRSRGVKRSGVSRRSFGATVRHIMCDLVLPSLGEEASEFLAERNLLLRHGTSLSLMSLVGTALNESEEFAEIDVSADWEKWSTRRPDFSLYYAALLDPARDGADAVQCVLRAVLDGVPSPSPPHRPRLIIDYVTTRPVARGRGLASLLVDFVVETSRACGANTYVLAIEESCVYWMGKDFVLEAGRPLNARLNIFPDTHLLRRVGDPDDAGDEADLDLQVEFEEEGGEEGEEGRGRRRGGGGGGGGRRRRAGGGPRRRRHAGAHARGARAEAGARALGRRRRAAAAAASCRGGGRRRGGAGRGDRALAPGAAGERSRTADENSPPEPSAGESS